MPRIPPVNELPFDARIGARGGASVSYAAVVALSVLLTIPRSFPLFKVVLLAVFIIPNLPAILSIERRFLQPAVINFYGVVIAIGVVWSAIGFATGGYVDGVYDSLRLYVVWGLAYALLIQILQMRSPFETFHYAIILAGFGISGLNIIGLYGSYFGAALLPYDLVQSLDLRIGYHQGYVQITSQNIGSLFFIVPYMIATLVRADGRREWRKALWVSLALCLFVVLLSGRRGLWATVAFVPVICLLLSVLSRTVIFNTNQAHRFAWIGFGIGVLVVYFVGSSGWATLEFIASAFSDSDERTIQSRYLLAGFENNPLFGSGFGHNAGYTRSIKYPWLYELTYHQLLYNTGAFGFMASAGLAFYYFRLNLVAVSSGRPEMAGAFPLIVGLSGFLIGAYGNPYLGSFDFLLIVAILPLVAATYERMLRIGSA